MPTDLQVSPEFLAATCGAILSLIFSYVPSVRDRWATLTKEQQQLGMAGLILITTAALFGLGCVGFIGISGFACSKGTAVQYGWMALYALAANQGVYKLSPQVQTVKALRIKRDTSVS